jgi:citrate synthase
MSTAVAGKGLEGIVAANSGICWIDGEAGILSYRGIDIHELAVHSTFEETTYLLWFGRLPTEAELQDFTAQLAASRVIDPSIVALLKSFPPSATPMEVLRTAVSALSMYDADEADNLHDANVRKAFRLTSQIGMIVAIYDRMRKGSKSSNPTPRSPTPPTSSGCSTAKSPRKPPPDALDVALILHADHELNASTFAARVIAATLSDIHSAVTGAIGALKGPLHGGANEAVMRMLYAIDEAGSRSGRIRARHARRQEEGLRLRPPRLQDRRPARHAPAPHVRRALGKTAGVTKWYDWSRAIELFVKPKSSSTPTSTSTPPPPTPRWASTSTSSRPSSPSAASPAGPRTSSSSTTTTASSAPAPNTSGPHNPYYWCTMTGSQGTVVHAEMVVGDGVGRPEGDSFKGVVQDGKGNIYKFVL